MDRRTLVPLSAALLLAAAAPGPAGAQDTLPSPGVLTTVHGIVSATFSFGTTGLITYAAWRLVWKGLSEVVGDRMARFAAGFACLVVLSAGLRVADGFLTRSGIPLLQAVSNGMVETFVAVIGPSAMSPVEFLCLLGLALFATYWMVSRFPPKTPWDQLRERIDNLSDRVSFLEK